MNSCKPVDTSTGTDNDGGIREGRASRPQRREARRTLEGASKPPCGAIPGRCCAVDDVAAVSKTAIPRTTYSIQRHCRKRRTGQGDAGDRRRERGRRCAHNCKVVAVPMTARVTHSKVERRQRQRRRWEPVARAVGVTMLGSRRRPKPLIQTIVAAIALAQGAPVYVFSSFCEMRGDAAAASK